MATIDGTQFSTFRCRSSVGMNKIGACTTKYYDTPTVDRLLFSCWVSAGSAIALFIT
ncbi:hypothetical protein Plhal304r1_c043g0123831 [Plasmopara halstedii]